MSKLAEIESLLFIAGRATYKVNLDSSLYLRQVWHRAWKLAEEITKKDEDSSLALLETSSRAKIVTKQDFLRVFAGIFKSPYRLKFIKAALKPYPYCITAITRVEVDEIRGVSLVVRLPKVAILTWSAGKRSARAPKSLTTDYFGLYGNQ